METFAGEVREALVRADVKSAWKVVVRASKPVVDGQASDDDVLELLPLLDELEQIQGKDVRHARVYEAKLIRNAALRNPSIYPRAAAVQQARADAAAEAQRSRFEQAEAARVEQNLGRLSERLPMVTTPTIAGREIARAYGVVSGSCVMSRNFLSDIGSDLSSTFGGQLGGIERAIESARETALDRLEQAARDLGAHAVVGVDLSVQTVADKAQLVLLFGTAVELV